MTANLGELKRLIGCYEHEASESTVDVYREFFKGSKVSKATIHWLLTHEDCYLACAAFRALPYERQEELEESVQCFKERGDDDGDNLYYYAESEWATAEDLHRFSLMEQGQYPFDTDELHVVVANNPKVQRITLEGLSKKDTYAGVIAKDNLYSLYEREKRKAVHKVKLFRRVN